MGGGDSSIRWGPGMDHTVFKQWISHAIWNHSPKAEELLRLEGSTLSKKRGKYGSQSDGQWVPNGQTSISNVHAQW